MRITEVPARVLQQVLHRPFGRFNAGFYETVAAPAVAEIIGPVVAERIATHLDATGLAGPIVDVGAGGGALAARIAANTGRQVVAVEPSAHSFERLVTAGHTDVEARRGTAEALPVEDHSCAAVYSSCTVKHWRDLDDGLVEHLRVAAPGALLLTVEIDGHDPTEVRTFARRTRIPDRLDWLYAQTVGRGFEAIERAPEEVAAGLERLGATDIAHDRIPGLPFWVVSAVTPA